MKFAVVLIILAINLKFSGASKIWPKAQELRKAHQDMLLRSRDQMPQAAEGVDAGNAIHKLLWSKNPKFRDPKDPYWRNDKGPLPNPYWPKLGCVRGCPKILSPVCGSNGKTYGNACSFQIAACLAKKKGLLLTSVVGSCNPGCVRACPRISRPVCGSNGKTYVNNCSFKIAACFAKKKGLLLTSVKGSCKEAVKREEKAEAAAEEEESKIGRMD